MKRSQNKSDAKCGGDSALRFIIPVKVVWEFGDEILANGKPSMFLFLVLMLVSLENGFSDSLFINWITKSSVSVINHTVVA